MSGWLMAVREVYEAGGSIPVNRMYASADDIRLARLHGLLEPACHRGQQAKHAPVVLSRKGRDLAEGRLAMYVPHMGHKADGGRMPGSHRRWCATWLAALPRANEIRLQGSVDARGWVCASCTNAQQLIQLPRALPSP